MSTFKKLSGTVTSSPNELPILSGVVEQAADDNHKLIYADWLEDRGDPRGPFLREFMQSLQEGKKLPSPRGISAAWQEMSGVSLLRKMAQAGVAQHRALMLARTLPMLALQTTKSSDAKIPVGSTKFGGNPDLPQRTPWPRGHGEPLEFLAQFDLIELHKTVAGQALPRNGLLSFFIHRQHTDPDFQQTEGIQVLHTQGRAKLIRQEPPKDYKLGFQKRSPTCRVTITELLDLPERLGSWVKELGEAAVAVRRIKIEIVDRSRSAAHQLFGHAHVNVLDGNPKPGPDWRPLIRFESDGKLGWCWQDAHWLLWFIKTASLARGDFTETEAMDV